jgi:hypothetical protein
MAIVMGVFPSLFLGPMEVSVKRVVERVQSVQPVRVENKTREMQNAEFRMQTGRGSARQDERLTVPKTP